MCGFSCKKKERKVLNSSLSSLTHRNARTIKLVSLRVRRICVTFLFGDPDETRTRVTAVKGRCLNRLTTGPYI